MSDDDDNGNNNREPARATFWRQAHGEQACWPLFALARDRSRSRLGTVTGLAGDRLALAARPGRGNNPLESRALSGACWLLPSWWLAELVVAPASAAALPGFAGLLVVMLIVLPWLLQLAIILGVYLPTFAIERIIRRRLPLRAIATSVCLTALTAAAAARVCYQGGGQLLAAGWLLFLLVNAGLLPVAGPRELPDKQ